MADPFRGEICAAWLDYLGELSPEELQTVMEAVATDCAADAVRNRTRDVYLVDLAYANDSNHFPYHAISDQPGAM